MIYFTKESLCEHRTQMIHMITESLITNTENDSFDDTSELHNKWSHDQNSHVNTRRAYSTNMNYESCDESIAIILLHPDQTFNLLFIF